MTWQTRSGQAQLLRLRHRASVPSIYSDLRIADIVVWKAAKRSS